MRVVALELLLKSVCNVDSDIVTLILAPTAWVLGYQYAAHALQTVSYFYSEQSFIFNEHPAPRINPNKLDKRLINLKKR